MQLIKGFFQSFIDAARAWLEDRVSLYAAAIAYYLVFSLAPLLVLAISIAGLVLDEQLIQNEIIALVEQYIKTDASQEIAIFILDMIEGAMNGSASTGIISFIILIFAASGIFNKLKGALDLIFGVIPRPQVGIQAALITIRTRAVSSLMVLLMGGILMIIMMLNTILSILNNQIATYFPSIAEIIPSVNTYIIPIVMVFLFTILFKTLPHAIISWWDVLIGAAVTTVLILIGNYIINIYLRFSSTASVYGAAGSLIVILAWIYYTAQIMLYGAEFTKSLANRMGRPIVPAEDGMYLADRLLERSELENGREELESEPEPALPSTPFGKSFDEPYQQTTATNSHQRRKQVATGLFGLAIGLFLGFISSLISGGDD
ncbi:MAG: YihY/virulence factor BrkB family protein [Anaerolineales bacterium]|nr:YihY/virulence factor BrkB family protein [Anaerolineales bacterium]